MSLSYLINQSSKFIWYSAHYIISFKYATPIKIDKTNPPPFYGKMPSGRKLFFEMMKLLNEERKLINSKESSKLIGRRITLYLGKIKNNENKKIFAK